MVGVARRGSQSRCAAGPRAARPGASRWHGVRRRGRERHGDRKTAAGRAFGGRRPAVGLGHRGDDRQTQARTTVAPAARRAAPVEAFEQARQLVGADHLAGVGDAQHGAVGAPADFDGHDAVGAGVPHGVADEVVDQALEERAVAADRRLPGGRGKTTALAPAAASGLAADYLGGERVELRPSPCRRAARFRPARGACR